MASPLAATVRQSRISGILRGCQGDIATGRDLLLAARAVAPAGSVMGGRSPAKRTLAWARIESYGSQRSAIHTLWLTDLAAERARQPGSGNAGRPTQHSNEPERAHVINQQISRFKKSEVAKSLPTKM